MIYFIIFCGVSTLMDIKDLKESNNKKDIAFYILFMAIVLLLGIFYYINPERKTIAEIVIKLFNMEGV